MTTIKLTKENTDAAIAEAIAVLQRGGIVAYPTETFYGLGVKFDMPGALERLYELKRRPREKAMPVVIGEEEGLSQVVSGKWLRNIPQPAKALMERFWPGPLTLLLPSEEGLSEYLTAETGLIAVRVPGESFALELAKKAGFAITATSANPSGLPPADTAEAVTGYFGEDLDLLIDGGKTPGGLPSTIVAVSGERIAVVREGAIKASNVLRR